VVEIGPGLGALTAPLAARLNQLHAVELDRDIVAGLQANYPPGRLVIHSGDVLEFDFPALGTELRIVGNLPYNISTPILFHLARSAGCIRDIHVMLQREVVARIVARPGTAQYGRLSIMLQYHFTAEKVLDVSASAFLPVPKVESAVVRMTPRRSAGPRCSNEALLEEIGKAAFSQRRKTLRNALRDYLQPTDFAALAIAPGARAQELSVDDFVRIADYLDASRRRHVEYSPAP
jgi:16S rRNA (adenine1518-N6/adenine1519-N6)-dimethyltransferase